jgi:hypothetical protein
MTSYGSTSNFGNPRPKGTSQGPDARGSTGVFLAITITTEFVRPDHMKPELFGGLSERGIVFEALPGDFRDKLRPRLIDNLN